MNQQKTNREKALEWWKYSDKSKLSLEQIANRNIAIIHMGKSSINDDFSDAQIEEIYNATFALSKEELKEITKADLKGILTPFINLAAMCAELDSGLTDNQFQETMDLIVKEGKKCKKLEPKLRELIDKI